MKCVKKWAKMVFTSPLKLEFEDEGKTTVMCDRRAEITAVGRRKEELRVRREDKNLEWCCGYEAERKRVRFMPPEVQPGQKTIASWLVGRWIDELNKYDSCHHTDGEASLEISGAPTARGWILLQV